MRLKCFHCKSVFDEEEAIVECVRPQTMWEPAEYQGYCPHCGAYEDDADECEVCDNCGEGIVGAGLIETELGNYCHECANSCYPALYAEYVAI